MKILIITNKNDITSDFIVKSLKERALDFYRFNTDELTKSINITLNFSQNEFYLFDENLDLKIDLKKVKSVYFRRPELPTFNLNGLNKGEETLVKSEITYTLEGIYKILRNAYWISPIYAIREAENKIYQLELAKSIGFTIPNSIISNSYKNLKNFYTLNKRDCIIKPIKSGLIDDNKKPKVVFTNELREMPDNEMQLRICPNYFQNQIKKQGDVRVTMVGKKVFASLIHSQNNSITKTDWRRGENILKHSKIELPSDIINKCIELLQILNLKYGAIDFVLDKTNKLIFLEINPNGQWAWIENQTGYKISNEIVNLLEYENF